MSTPERLLLLRRTIEEDLAAVDRHFVELPPAPLEADSPEERLIVVGYRLHNLYNGFESIFLSIARTFENEIDRDAGWHAQLLRRMHLDLSPLRPAVIDEEAYRALDELLRFRHVYRSLYATGLDAEHMSLALRAALRLRQVYRAQLERFLRALDEMA